MTDRKSWTNGLQPRPKIRNQNQKQKEQIMNTVKLLAAVCSWTARVAGALLVIFAVVIAVGEGMPNPFTQPLAIQIGFLALAMILIGILAGWRWELAGGVLSLAGWCL